MLSYREATDGQVLEEGITEAGSMASFQAAGTSYATHGQPMIPFYIFYSMFGFQRTGDQMWAFGDARGRGFLMGATAGRTTLDRRGAPARRRPLAHPRLDGPERPRLRPGLRLRAGGDRPRRHRADVRQGRGRLLLRHALQRELRRSRRSPTASTTGSSAGIYRFARGARPRPQGAAARGSSGRARSSSRSVAARDLLAEKFGVAAEVYSAPSFPLLRRDALEAERWNRLHPTETPRVPYVATVLGPDGGPIVAATDWLKALPDMVSRWLPPYYVSLGTDGFGRSGTREDLRALFEIDPPHIAAATLVELARCGALPADKAAKAIRELGIDPEKLDPVAL